LPQQLVGYRHPRAVLRKAYAESRLDDDASPSELVQQFDIAADGQRS